MEEEKIDVLVNTTVRDSLGVQIMSIVKFLNQVKDLGQNDININFRNYRYSPPLLATFFASFLEYNKHITMSEIQQHGYLNSICFPNGLEFEIPNWSDKLAGYSTKSFLPLIHFSTGATLQAIKDRNDVISQSVKIVCQIAKLPSNYFSAISYLFSEITDNIVCHSKQSHGWIGFQYYKSKGYIDFCIADSGIGLLESYKSYIGDKDFSHIVTHIDAITNVIKGMSTKHLNERGFGVHTSREMLIKGLGATFIIISGDALLVDYEVTDLKAFHNGTLLVVRFPTDNVNKSFHYLNFIE